MSESNQEASVTMAQFQELANNVGVFASETRAEQLQLSQKIDALLQMQQQQPPAQQPAAQPEPIDVEAPQEQGTGQLPVHPVPLAKIPIAQPEKFSGDKGDVHLFLRNLRRYFDATGLDPNLWGKFAGQFLVGKALKFWDVKLMEFERRNESPTFTAFDTALSAHFGNVLPVHETRMRYEALKQKGSVSDFVRELSQLYSELHGTPMAPSEYDVISHFLRNMKPSVQKYLTTNAPRDWWKDASAIFDKAMQFELNTMSAQKHCLPVDEQKESDLKTLSALASKYGKSVTTKKSKKRKRKTDSQPAQPAQPAQPPQPQPPAMPAYPGNVRNVTELQWKARVSAQMCGY